MRHLNYLRHAALGLLLVLSAPARPVRAQAAPEHPAEARPQIIGHAGSGFFTPLRPFNALPPSSLAGIRKALKRGADGVEIDVQLSRDGVLMLYHDATLDGRTPGHGCVNQFSAAELQQLPYRGGFPYDLFQHEHVATLEQLLQQLAARGPFPYLHLDLHEGDPCRPARGLADSPALVQALGRLLRHYRVPAAKVLMVSSHPGTLQRLRRELPGVALGLEITDALNERLPLAVAARFQAVVLPKKLITPAISARVHAAGLQVVVFNGRSPKAVRRVLGCQPDAYEVDNVAAALRLRRRHPQPPVPAPAAPPAITIRTIPGE